MRREFYNYSLSSREAVRIELPPYRVYYFKNFADKGVEICVKIFIQQVEELQKSQMHGLKDKNNPFVILRWYHYASHRLKGNIRL